VEACEPPPKEIWVHVDDGDGFLERRIRSEFPEVYTCLEIDCARFFHVGTLTQFLNVIAWHVTTGNPKNDDFIDARVSIQSALTGALWDDYRIWEFDNLFDHEHWGELTVSFNGTAFFYLDRREVAKTRRPDAIPI
jgi:hypothetical protein